MLYVSPSEMIDGRQVIEFVAEEAIASKGCEMEAQLRYGHAKQRQE